MGDIDAYTVRDLMLRLAASLETACPRVLVLDLTKVTFLAATAIHALDLFTEDAQARRTSVRIVAGPAGAARRSLLITGAFHSLVSFPSLQSARAA
ncbi:STAS domain-containing protein [Amycolatopsis saalfeldensis]|uniref:STAS domain-containing protein n=1 Tax=Amycolatopsis saalfeldensis TaxID=394193 RepID=UPI000B89ECF2|nr:STAS domain-containing protein [Amycolatopsis saalfeldensis]